jgi:hypothetical protein
VSSYYSTCVLAPLYMCPHSDINGLGAQSSDEDTSCRTMRTHTTILCPHYYTLSSEFVPPNSAHILLILLYLCPQSSYICVLRALYICIYLCPHTTIYLCSQGSPLKTAPKTARKNCLRQRRRQVLTLLCFTGTQVQILTPEGSCTNSSTNSGGGKKRMLTYADVC